MFLHFIFGLPRTDLVAVLFFLDAEVDSGF